MNSALQQAFRDEGYLKFESVVPTRPLAELTFRIREEFEQAKAKALS